MAYFRDDVSMLNQDLDKETDESSEEPLMDEGGLGDENLEDEKDGGDEEAM